MITLYEVLNSKESATPEEIKSAYRQLAMKWHPDRNLDNRSLAEKKFKEIGAAYKVLFDPQQRAAYDDELAAQRTSHSYKQQSTSSSGPTMSEDDAEKMFFEQMLDLAMELASRGLSAEKIFKMLLALDCPESIAKVVAENAVSSSNYRSSAENKHTQEQQGGTATSKPISIESMSWDEAVPYYAAVIGGVHADDRLGNEQFEEKMIVYRKQIKGYWYSFLLFIIGCIVIALAFPQDGSKVASPILLFIGGTMNTIGFFGFPVILIWRFKTDSTMFRRERTLRYYLTVFECYHNARPVPFKLRLINIGAFFGSIFWLPYRRMPGFALIVVVTVAVITSIEMLIEFDYPAISKGLGSALPGISMGIWVIANRTYFADARKRIKSIFELPRERALTRLRELGGVNSWSWLGFLVLLFVLIIPASVIQDMANTEKAAVAAQQQAEKERADVIVAAQQRAEADAAETRKMDALISEIEKNYPVLNEKSPQYNQKFVDDALARQSAYIKQGQSGSNALQMAIDDMDREYNSTAEAVAKAKRAEWLIEQGVSKEAQAQSPIPYKDANNASISAATERRKMDALVAAIEKEYPVLNVDSPKYSQKVVDIVLSKKRAYIKQGQTDSDSLQRAVDEVMR